MTPSDAPDQGPAGPLGRAFADLAADAPPTSLSADAVIASAHQESHRRHRWVLGTGVAAAVVAVSTLIWVSVSQTGSGDSSTAASESTAVAGGSPPALASSPPSKPGSAAGGGSAEPDGQGGDSGETAPEAAPTSANCEPALSGAQERAVLAALPGLEAAQCTAAESEGDVIAASAFAGDGVTVTVVVGAGDSGCPSDEQSACATVDGHPGVLVLATPSDRPVNEGTSTTVIGENGGRTATITVERDGAPGDLPYAVEDLATLAGTLLGG